MRNTLTIVISKSGGTKETRNGMLEAQAAYHEAGLHFGRHAVAITGEGQQARPSRRKRALAGALPDVGLGRRPHQRNSAPSACLPAALQGFDIDAMISRRGANGRSHAQRSETQHNPAALLAAMWFHATGGQGKKDMVILPYKDRLELFSRYLQQLVMESLGKEKDLDRQRRASGTSRFTATKARPISTLMCSSCAMASTTFS